MFVFRNQFILNLGKQFITNLTSFAGIYINSLLRVVLRDSGRGVDRVLVLDHVERSAAGDAAGHTRLHRHRVVVAGLAHRVQVLLATPPEAVLRRLLRLAGAQGASEAAAHVRRQQVALVANPRRRARRVVLLVHRRPVHRTLKFRSQFKLKICKKKKKTNLV